MAAIHPELDGSFRPRQIYEQVSERIRDEIAAGRFLPDSRLPSLYLTTLGHQKDQNQPNNLKWLLQEPVLVYI